jgi:hypothetical protein
MADASPPLIDTVRTGFAVKVAVTDFEASIVTSHGSAVHAPLHPAKLEVRFGLAVSVTVVPAVYGSVQSLPQLIPTGSLVTVPAPPPAFVTVSTGLFEKVAVTNFGPFIVRVQVVVVPVHAPLHPANTVLPCGVAVSVTPVTTS